MRGVQWLLAVMLLAGCAVRLEPEAYVFGDEISLCRVAYTSTATYRICRTHPAVTPEILAEARLIH